MRINRVAASAIVGAVVGVAAVLSVAAASDDVAPDVVPVDPAVVVVEVEVEETDPASLDRDGYTVEVETDDAGDAGEVAPVDPAPAPNPLPTSTPEPREETGEEVPALPVGAYVYFEDWEIPEALIYGADVPCWQDLDERIVCWFEGATGAESQG